MTLDLIKDEDVNDRQLVIKVQNNEDRRKSISSATNKQQQSRTQSRGGITSGSTANRINFSRNSQNRRQSLMKKNTQGSQATNLAQGQRTVQNNFMKVDQNVSIFENENQIDRGNVQSPYKDISQKSRNHLERARYSKYESASKQIDSIEKSYQNIQKLTYKTHESQFDRFQQLDQSDLSKRIIHKIKKQQRELLYKNSNENKGSTISDHLYEHYLKSKDSEFQTERPKSNLSKFKIIDPLNIIEKNQNHNINLQQQLNQHRQKQSDQILNAKSSRNLKSRNQDQSPVINYFNTLGEQKEKQLVKTEQQKKQQTFHLMLKTPMKTQDQSSLEEIVLDPRKYHEEDYDIHDTRLKKFYSHLDHINHKSVSTFQYFKRYKLSQQELNKGDVQESVNYKLQNNIHSQYQTTDYFPQWIVDEMQKIEQNTSFSNQNIFKLCQKLHKERGINDRRAICNYLKNKVNFFKDIEKEKLETLTQKIATLEYEPNQTMIKQGDEGDFLLIIYEGKVEIQVDGRKVAEAGPHTLIGEAALEYKQKRKASVLAMTKCKCLALYKADYDSAVALFKSQQKHQNQNLLRQLHVIGDWNIIKIKGFSRLLNEVQFPKGKIIYEIGDSPETLYIIKRGRVSLEILYEIERTNSIPVAQKQWEIQRTFHVVRRNILTLGQTSIFGMEETTLENSKRIIRARALEDTECLYANKTAFMEYFNTDDKEKFKQIIADYTDFEKEGKQLLFEIQNKKNIVNSNFFVKFLVQSNLFLNAVNLNLGSITQESRSTSQNGYLTSHHFNPKKNKMVKQFLQRITQDKTDSPLDALKMKNTKRQQYIEDYYKSQSNNNQSVSGIDTNLHQSSNQNVLQNENSVQTLQDMHNIGTIGEYLNHQISMFSSRQNNNSVQGGSNMKYLTPEQKMREYKAEMIEMQKKKKETKTIKVNKQSFLVNSNSVLENIKGQQNNNNRSKSQKVGGGNQPQNNQNVQFVENGVKIRLITEKPQDK
eukprot:403360397